jgi:hypothetical protein
MHTRDKSASHLTPETLHVIGERCRAVFPLDTLDGFEGLLSELDGVQATATSQGVQSRGTTLQPGREHF